MGRWTKRGASRRGSALLIALIGTVVLAGMSMAILAVGAASKREHVAATEHMQALYVAEAGLSQGIAALTAAATPNLGTQDLPRAFSDGSFWGTTDAIDVDTTVLTVFGTSRGTSRALEAVVVKSSDGVYSSALFAGNSSGDPTYDLKFGGTGTSADRVTGNVYSGGNILITGSATIDGTARATGAITGGSGETGITQPIPNLAGMDYAVHHDINVASAFASGSATYTSSSSYGGSAWRLP